MYKLKTIGTSIGIAFSVLTSSLPFGGTLKKTDPKVKPSSVTSQYSQNEVESQIRMDELVEETSLDSKINTSVNKDASIISNSIKTVNLSSNKSAFVENNETRYKAFVNRIYESLIKEYADYYHLDSNKVITIAKKLTKNYEIDFMEINNTKAYRTDDLEASIMIFVDQLNKDQLIVPLKSIGYSVNSLRTKDTIDTMKPGLKLSSGETFSEFLGKIANLLDVNRDYALAISLYETGWEKSYLAQKKNNFGGLLNSSGYLTFITPEAGIIAYLRNLKSYESYNFNNIYSFSGLYVNGNPNYPNRTWVNNVLWFKNEVVKNHDTYFPTKVETGTSFMMSLGPCNKG